MKAILEKKRKEIQDQIKAGAPPQEKIGEIPDGAPIVLTLAKTSLDDFQRNPFIDLKLAPPPVFIKALKGKKVKEPRQMASLYYAHALTELLSHLCNQMADLHLSVVALLGEPRSADESPERSSSQEPSNP